MLFLLFLDFEPVSHREDEEFVEREQVFADNVDLGRAQKPSFCWCALDKAARASVTISFSSNSRGAILVIPLK